MSILDLFISLTSVRILFIRNDQGEVYFPLFSKDCFFLAHSLPVFESLLLSVMNLKVNQYSLEELPGSQ